VVVPRWIDREFSEELAGCGVNDSNLEIVDQHEDVGSPVGSSDPNVVQLTVEPKAHLAELVNAIASHSREHVVVPVARTRFGSSCIGNSRG